ncbi:ATP-binding cassette, subfamily C [Acrasis kona]|uniref:ATP-binding cassette, subfamily C n=1 Tax=Acrasis kona TaxID=1008807 RepID=A0AAW2Z4X5_9EUKA
MSETDEHEVVEADTLELIEHNVIEAQKEVPSASNDVESPMHLSGRIDEYFTQGVEEGDQIAIQEKHQKVTPEIDANFFSRITFWWFNALVVLGYKKVLEMGDLFHLREEDRAKNVGKILEHHWEEELKKKNPSLLLAIHRAFGTRFYLAGIIKVMYDVIQLVSPVFIRLLIQFVSDPTIDTYYGYAYVFGLTALNLVGLLMIHQYFHIVTRQGMNITTGLRHVIYSKSLRISSRAKQSMNTGDIINVMSIDSQKIGDLITYLHMLWSGVFQITVCLAFLFQLVGVSTLAGLGVMLISIPSQAVVARLVARLRRTMLKFTGERIKIINELLQGIRVIKFYAWENSFIQRAANARSLEMGQIKKTMIVNTISSSIMTLAPLFVSLGTFALFAGLGNPLDASVIFPALSYFNLLQFPMTFFPTIIALVAESKVSVSRISNFLQADQINDRETFDDFGTPVVIEDASFSWGVAKPEATSTDDNINMDAVDNLRNINFKVERGSLTCIVGLVGAGKSTLLSAIIGEISQTSGTTRISTRNIAYCPQQSWIQNGSVKENITFGLPYDEKKYKTAIRCCCLERDLEILPAGDQTEIGEKGINLSGGQRQRISLARAVYCDADTYLFDDVLSAVDAHVGKTIFDECINGVLKDKTRILVTHQWQYLKYSDHVTVVKNGEISESGTFSHVTSGGEFSETMKQFSVHHDEDEEMESPKPNQESSSLAKQDEKQQEQKQEPKKKEGGQLMVDEERTSGNVKWNIYSSYIRYAGGYFWVVLILVGFIFTQSMMIINSWWLAYWSQDSIQPNPGVPFYIGVYMAIGLGAAFLQFIREILFSLVGLWASSNLHQTALKKVVYSPTRFFDTTPAGRIINRFSKDTESIDSSLIGTLKSFLSCFTQVLGTLVLLSIVTPFFLIPLAPILIVYFTIQQYYRHSSRELKRLGSIARSPLFAYFGETLSGVSTIRAYNEQIRFQNENCRKIDMSNKAVYCQLISQRWLGVRLEFVGRFIVFFAAIFAVVGRSTLNGGIAGLTLTYALQITGVFNWAVRSVTETESNMNAVERVLYYCDEIDQEAAPIVPNNRPSEDWPLRGDITFEKVGLRYRSDLDPVLVDFSAQIFASEKIGVVGRTGAGKSTLMTALFRLVELDTGSIIIDGVDTAQIGLYDLRSKLSIIPQDPVLFSGTVRFNLDPEGVYNDEQIWQALERAHMKDVVDKLPNGLEDFVTEYGENFSVGQRQLFCLARAILLQTRVLVLDEATASVDVETDALIQQTIRQEFADRTVLTIAHRLNTIIDCDRIMVLEKGELAEFDTPKALLNKHDSMFYGLVRQTGKANTKYLKKIANGEISYSSELNNSLNKLNSQF